MPLKVTYTNDNFDKDHEWDVPGLGIIQNGVPTTISKEQEEQFVLERRMTVKDAVGDSEYVKVEGTTEVNGGVKSVLGVDPAELIPADETVVPNLDAQTTAIIAPDYKEVTN